MKKIQEMLKSMNQEDRRVGTCPVCRLYGHVREFSPAREEEVIVMRQVTEIYGRENGLGPFCPL